MKKQQNIIKLLETPIDSSKIKKVTGYHIINYPQLNKMKDIDQAFGKFDAFILYFEINSIDYGHWTCLIRRHNEYEFFDPYGLNIDNEFNYITKSKRIELNEQFNSLSRLLDDKRKQGYNIIHNTYRIQKFDFKYNNVDITPETCGKHTSARLINIDKPLNTFVLDVYTKNHNLGENDDIIICLLFPNHLRN
jgi:hypothetical protein